jgi:hypothetical protein
MCSCDTELALANTITSIAKRLDSFPRKPFDRSAIKGVSENDNALKAAHS